MKQILTIYVDTERDLIFTSNDYAELWENFNSMESCLDFEDWVDEMMDEDVEELTQEDDDWLRDRYNEYYNEQFENYLDGFLSRKIEIYF